MVDDFFIGFNSEKDARECLDKLRRFLWEYNLHLNENKTSITRSSLIYGEGWRHELERFPLGVGSASKQRSSLESLLDATLRLCEVRRDAQAAAFFCGRVRKVTITPTNFELVRDTLLRMGRDFTTCLKFVFEFVISNLSFCQTSKSKSIFVLWIKEVLRDHAPRGHDLEVSWMLVLCGVLGLNVDQQFMGLDDRIVSPVVLSMLGLLSSDGLLAEKWDEWKPTEDGIATVEDGRNWLPYYEAVRRNWTSNTGITKPIKTHPLFSKLLAQDVTFLDDSDFLTRRNAQPSAPLPLPNVGMAKRRPSSRMSVALSDDYA